MSDSIFPIQGVNQFMCIRYNSLGNKIHEIESTIKDVRSNDDPQFNGKCTKYHPSGKLWQEGGYKMGNPHGKFISCYENGKIEAIGEYYYGKKYNLWKNYDKDGTILSITKYDQYGYEIGIPRNELTEEEIIKLGFKFD